MQFASTAAITGGIIFCPALTASTIAAKQFCASALSRFALSALIFLLLVSLLLLAMQPSTVEAFSTATGAGILFIGLCMTVLAYIWMTFLSRLPSVPRVFGGDR